MAWEAAVRIHHHAPGFVELSPRALLQHRGPKGEAWTPADQITVRAATRSLPFEVLMVTPFGSSAGHKCVGLDRKLP